MSSTEAPPPYSTLGLLCLLLRQHISRAKTDLMSASMTTPMYGVLQSIRALLELDWVRSASGKRWGPVLGELIEICQRLSEVVSPVVCSSSPEGFLLEGAPDDGLTEGALDEGSLTKGTEVGNLSEGSAQSLLLCCWHTMKEVSLLLSHLVQTFGAVMESGVPILTHNQVCLISHKVWLA